MKSFPSSEEGGSGLVVVLTSSETTVSLAMDIYVHSGQRGETDSNDSQILVFDFAVAGSCCFLPRETKRIRLF
jgi:hypothetical protein